MLPGAYRNFMIADHSLKRGFLFEIHYACSSLLGCGYDAEK